eukprot:1136295-Pelagomonas_calceolata.AAC.4
MDGLKRESSTLERKFKPQCLNANASISMNGGTHKVAIEGTCNSFEPTFPFPYLMQPEFNMKETELHCYSDVIEFINVQDVLRNIRIRAHSIQPAYTRPGQQLEAAQRQHADLCKDISGKAVTLHTILLGVGGTCYTEHTLNQLKQLELDHQCAIKLARKLCAHSVMYANKLVPLDVLLETTQPAPGASFVVEETHGSSEPMCLPFLNWCRESFLCPHKFPFMSFPFLAPKEKERKLRRQRKLSLHQLRKRRHMRSTLQNCPPEQILKALFGGSDELLPRVTVCGEALASLLQLALLNSAQGLASEVPLQFTSVHMFGLVTSAFLLQLSCPCRQPSSQAL